MGPCWPAGFSVPDPSRPDGPADGLTHTAGSPHLPFRRARPSATAASAEPPTSAGAPRAAVACGVQASRPAQVLEASARASRAGSAKASPRHPHPAIRQGSLDEARPLTVIAVLAVAYTYMF